MNNAKTLRVILLALLMLAVSAAFLLSKTAPFAAGGEKAVRDRISKDAEGRISLTSFRKVDGSRAETMMGTMYSLEFEAEIEFTEDCKWLSSGYGLMPGNPTFHTAKPPTNQSVFGSLMESATSAGMLVKMGQRARVEGVVRFLKKESGWVADEVALGKAELVGGS